MTLLNAAELVPTLEVDYVMILKNVIISFGGLIKTCWLPLLAVIILSIISNVLRVKNIQRNREIKAQREEQLWEQRMEKFLEKKEQHERERTKK